MNFLTTLKRIGFGFWGAFRKLTLLLGFVLGISLIGFVLVLPLWYFADQHRSGYSIFVLLLFSILTIFLLWSRYRNLQERYGGTKQVLTQRVLPSLAKSAKILVTLIVLYGIILLFVQGIYIVAVPLGVIFLFVFGYITFGR